MGLVAHAGWAKQAMRQCGLSYYYVVIRTGWPLQPPLLLPARQSSLVIIMPSLVGVRDQGQVLAGEASNKVSWAALLVGERGANIPDDALHHLLPSLNVASRASVMRYIEVGPVLCVLYMYMQSMQCSRHSRGLVHRIPLGHRTSTPVSVNARVLACHIHCVRVRCSLRVAPLGNPVGGHYWLPTPFRRQSSHSQRRKTTAGDYQRQYSYIHVEQGAETAFRRGQQPNPSPLVVTGPHTDIFPDGFYSRAREAGAHPGPTFCGPRCRTPSLSSSGAENWTVRLLAMATCVTWSHPSQTRDDAPACRFSMMAIKTGEESTYVTAEILHVARAMQRNIADAHVRVTMQHRRQPHSPTQTQ